MTKIPNRAVPAGRLSRMAHMGGLATRLAGGMLADDPSFRVPHCYTELCSENLLAMSFEQGVPVESLMTYPLVERNRCAALLLQLLFRELFEFGRVQTDPNFANFLYDPDNGQLVLLDFGATRCYSPTLVAAYRQLFHAGLIQDRQ